MFEQSPPISDATVARSSASERLNALSLTGPKIAAAMEVLTTLSAEHRDDPRAQALVLQAYATDAGFADEVIAGATLHARLTALAKWTAAHDPDRQSDPAAVMEAAARHPLVETSAGIGFEPAGFQELILFIEDLPW